MSRPLHLTSCSLLLSGVKIITVSRIKTQVSLMWFATRVLKSFAFTSLRMETVCFQVSFTSPRKYLESFVNKNLAMDHCLQSQNYVNVIVADKQEHLQYLTMEEAVEHCSKGIGIWPQFSTDAGEEPDVIMASCGDIMANESIAAIDLLLQNFPDLKIRCVNVVDLFKLIHHDDHPHGLKDRDWTALFTDDKPVIFSFHSYPWLVHRLTYRRKGSHNLHVRGKTNSI